MAHGSMAVQFKKNYSLMRKIAFQQIYASIQLFAVHGENQVMLAGRLLPILKV